MPPPAAGTATTPRLRRSSSAKPVGSSGEPPPLDGAPPVLAAVPPVPLAAPPVADPPLAGPAPPLALLPPLLVAPPVVVAPPLPRSPSTGGPSPPPVVLQAAPNRKALKAPRPIFPARGIIMLRMQFGPASIAGKAILAPLGPSLAGLPSAPYFSARRGSNGELAVARGRLDAQASLDETVTGVDQGGQPHGNGDLERVGGEDDAQDLGGRQHAGPGDEGDDDRVDELRNRRRTRRTLPGHARSGPPLGLTEHGDAGELPNDVRYERGREYAQRADEDVLKTAFAHARPAGVLGHLGDGNRGRNEIGRA